MQTMLMTDFSSQCHLMWHPVNSIHTVYLSNVFFCDDDCVFWSSFHKLTLYVLLHGVVTHGTVWHVADLQTLSHNSIGKLMQ